MWWIKCNTDEAARGCPGPTVSGAIFRDNKAVVVGCFSYFLGTTNAFLQSLSLPFCLLSLLLKEVGIGFG